MREQISALDRARKGWGRRLPDWITALARECDGSTQRAAAERIGYSAAVVNQVLSRTYKGQMARVERRVRVELMPETVQCPVLGPITEKICIGHQQRPSRANHELAELARACRRCANRKEN